MRPEAEGQTSGAEPALKLNEFETQLYKEFKAENPQRQSALQTAVHTLAEQALTATALVSDDAVKSIAAIIAGIDHKISEQLNLILHHEDFKKLEGSWRGLHHLVSNTETDEKLKIRVFNISKKEIANTLKEFSGTAWNHSPLFKKLYEEEFGTPGGQPYGALIGDYYFDHSEIDVAILKGMAQIAAAAHAPFITAPAPALFGWESWQELINPRDLTKIFQSAEYAPWRSLRDSEDARYLGLTMPRFLSRIPYGAKTTPVEEFAFEEDTGGADQNKYVWSNAAYAMGANITRSFTLYGWCTRIRGVESGGQVEGLPCHIFPTVDGGLDMKCPTEIAISVRREAELANNGMMALSHYQNTDFAVFVGAQSLQKPAVHDDPDTTANSHLGARLPYLFPVCRFVHYLQCMIRHTIGSFKEREDLESWLNQWILNYVTTNPNSSEKEKARRPLSAAQVTIQEQAGRPGYYQGILDIQPHFQLEGLTAPLRTAFRLLTTIP